ncbi:hypothetical protein M413DRAFT_447979 [Hebeloma cylindrosporum]|uniref:Uncharacterized protein n=1 Tax=Hebeloma cylindrosporum TaxID=76867 RepID=A0A0C2XKF5_HEBCY|nr:hypothetical protein M413DRAFT_447979 [Hebeloma cylindrosporum h7]
MASTLSSSVQRIGSPLQPSDKITLTDLGIPSLDGTPRLISGWGSLVTLRYISDPNSRNSIITEIKRMKARNGSLHEYVLAKVYTPSHGFLYLRVERARENKDSDGHPITTRHQREASSTLAWAVGQRPKPHKPWETPHELRKWCFPTVSDLGKPVVGAAYDFVRVYKLPGKLSPFKDIELESWDISQDALPLSHFALLSQLVHEQEEYYNLFHSQRHWFAYIIAQVVIQSRRCPLPPQPSHLEDIDHHYHLGSHTYIPIAANPARIEVTKVMTRRFLDLRSEFEAKLQSKIAIEENALHPERYQSWLERSRADWEGLRELAGQRDEVWGALRDIINDQEMTKAERDRVFARNEGGEPVDRPDEETEPTSKLKSELLTALSDIH